MDTPYLTTEEAAKVCTRPGCLCHGEPQPIENFPVRKDDRGEVIGAQSWCYACRSRYAKQRYQERVRRIHDQVFVA